MDKKLLLVVWFLTLALIFAYAHKAKRIKLEKPDFTTPLPTNPDPVFPTPPPVAPQPELTTPEPEWTDFQPLRAADTSLGKVLSDIESHMPAGHIYKDSDKITWGHETSHGIASQLRQKHQRGFCSNWDGKKWWIVEQQRINGFYVLNNRAVIIDEPNSTVSKAAALVPRSLRGGVYNLYMVQQAQSWNDTPLYVFDEWVAYGNGAAVRADLKIQSRQETVEFMLEFNNYAICLAMSCKSEDKQFKHFLMWNLERSMKLYEENRSIGDTSRSTAFLEKTKNSQDAEEMRQFARSYFGAEWTKKVLGY